MKPLVFLLIWSFIQSAPYVYAGIIGNTEITGRVLKYDNQTVTLSQYRNRKVKIPRSALKKDFKKLKTGMLVTAVFSAEEMMNQVEEQIRRKQKANKK